MPILTIREGGKESIHQIEGDEVTIGRAATNTIEIHDAAASKEHCRVQRVGDRWKVVDLESKNGTRVNGQPRNKAFLDNGDTIAIGKTTIRFGAGAAKRRAAAQASPAPSRRAAAAAAPVRARDRQQDDGGYDDDYDERPARRRYGASQSDKMMKVGLICVASVVMILVFVWVSKKFAKDTHNEQVLVYADQLALNDRWQEALEYLQAQGDPDGNRYQAVVDKIKELQERKEDYYRDRKRQQAVKIISRTELRIRAYNSGNRDITAAEILERIDRLKTDYADVDLVQEMKKTHPAWFAGKAPIRAVDLLAEGGSLLREWEQAVQYAREYEKEWSFREARETIERFLTTREANLDADEKEIYAEKVEAQLDRINKLAESVYYGRVQVARALARNKRWDQAIAEYRKVIDRFGLDRYVRKAQAEIGKLEEERAKE